MPQHSRMVRGAVYCHSQVVTSSIVSSRFLTCFLTCCPVSIWMSPRLNLSTVYNLFIPLYCALIPYFSYPSSLVQHFPFYNAMEYVAMPENILCFLRRVVFNMLLISVAHINTFLFVIFSVQLIFSIHISNASNSFLPALVNVQVSAVYSATFQTMFFISHLFC